jgi:hypothetical protein
MSTQKTQRPAGERAEGETDRTKDTDNRNPSADTGAAQAVRASLPQFTSRRRFIVWATMCGYVKPERLTERIVAELEEAP